MTIELVKSWIEKWIIEPWLDTLDTFNNPDKRRILYEKVKQHLAEYMVYYVFGLILLVGIIAIWMYSRDEDNTEVDKGKTGKTKTRIRHVMTGGVVIGGIDYTEDQLGTVPDDVLKNITNSNTLRKIIDKKKLNPKFNISNIGLSFKQRTAYTEATLKAAREPKTTEQVLSETGRMTALPIAEKYKPPTTLGPAKSIFLKGTEPPVPVKSTISPPTPPPLISFNKPVENPVEKPEAKPAENNPLQLAKNEPNKPEANVEQPKMKNAPPTGAPPGVFKAQSQSMAQAKANTTVTVTIQNPVIPAAAPAAPTDQPEKKTEAKPETAEPAKPKAGNAPQEQQTQGQKPPAKGSRENKGANEIAAAVKEAKEKEAAKQGEKKDKLEKKTAIAQQYKEASAQFARKAPGASEATNLLSQIKSGVGQQFSKLGGILFSIATAVGIGVAGTGVALERMAYNPAKTAATILTQI